MATLQQNVIRFAGWAFVDVEDTRSRDEHGRVVPFSGEQRPCDCCGRAIDVLVHIRPTIRDVRWIGGERMPVVEMGDASAIVGMACAKRLGLKDLRRERVIIIKPEGKN
jgi:hypothetical protein